jgi:hypothetical protein
MLAGGAGHRPGAPVDADDGAVAQQHLVERQRRDGPQGEPDHQVAAALPTAPSEKARAASLTLWPFVSSTAAAPAAARLGSWDYPARIER